MTTEQMDALDDERNRGLVVEMRMESIGVPRLPGGGVWIAFYSDYSGYAPFPSELEALRHAVASGMEVEFTPWGMSPSGARAARWEREREDKP